MVSDTAKTFCHIGLALNLILFSILAYGVKRVYDNRNQIQFSARHYEPLITVLTLSLIYIGVEANLQLYGSVGLFFDLGFSLRWTIKLFFALSFLSLYSLRCWLPHFDYHTGVAMFTRVTNIKLKPEETEAFEWFINNKAQYGSPKYMDRFLASISCALTVVFLVWTLISPATFHSGVAIVFVLLGCVSMTVVQKIRVLDDELFIRRELLTDFKIIAATYFVVGFFTMLGPVIGWPMTGWFLNEVSVLSVFLLGYMGTYWLLARSEAFTVPILMDLVSMAKSDKSATARFCEQSGLPQFGQMLEDPVVVATFLKHLVWELSVENLFFLSDVMRFKATFVIEGRTQQMNGFYHEVPNMLGRYTYKPEMGFVEYAWAISKAYVDNVSAFYVTGMDNDVRERILDYLSTLESEKSAKLEGQELENLICVFDDAARHVFALVKQAYGRFVRNQKLDLQQLKHRGGGGGPEPAVATTAGAMSAAGDGEAAPAGASTKGHMERLISHSDDATKE